MSSILVGTTEKSNKTYKSLQIDDLQAFLFYWGVKLFNFCRF